MKIYLLNCNYSFIILYFHPHPDTIFWQKAFHFLRPFNEAIISAIEIIFIADVIDFRFGFEAVEVEVIQDPLSYLPQRGRCSFPFGGVRGGIVVHHPNPLLRAFYGCT